MWKVSGRGSPLGSVQLAQVRSSPQVPEQRGHTSGWALARIGPADQYLAQLPGPIRWEIDADTLVGPGAADRAATVTCSDSERRALVVRRDVREQVRHSSSSIPARRRRHRERVQQRRRRAGLGRAASVPAARAGFRSGIGPAGLGENLDTRSVSKAFQCAQPPYWGVEFGLPPPPRSPPPAHRGISAGRAGGALGPRPTVSREKVQIRSAYLKFLPVTSKTGENTG